MQDNHPSTPLEFWIEFDQLWTRIHEQTISDSTREHYWQAIYDAMHHVVPEFQKLVGQDTFTTYIEEAHDAE
jgi:hypothetical protein